MKSIKIKSFLILFIIFIGIIVASNVYAADDIIVVLDPGHGGSDVGAVGGGIYEKDVNWKIATKVKEILDAEPGITGILSRSESACPSLAERAQVAKNNGADLLVSFHINSSTNSRITGSEVYITANTNSPRFYQASNTLGYAVLNNLASVGVPTHLYRPQIKNTEENRYYSDGFLADWYGIIREPMYFGIPGMIIEHCYISNPGDRVNYLNDVKINQMAEADARAIIANKELFRINKEDNFTNSEIAKLEVSSDKMHLTGEAIVVDWVNGMQTVPTGIPSIKLVSTDGTSTINCFVSQVWGNTYYFDTWLSSLDVNKQYKVEVSTADRVNVPVQYTVTSSLGTNRIIGVDNTYEYTVKNNLIDITTRIYKGDLNSDIVSLNTLKVSDNKYFIQGKIIAVEWIEGESNVPKTIPVIKLKSTDGTVNGNCFVKQDWGNTYYFDMSISNLDMSKEYILEIACENEYNLSENKKHQINLEKLLETVGRCQNDKVIKIKDNSLIFEDYTYVGNINSELVQFNVGVSGGATYVSGELIYVEWVDGQSTVPEIAPKMRFRSTDGIIDKEVFVTSTGTNTYYFDRYIEGIDTSKEYYFEIESGDPRNVSTSNKMNLCYVGTKFENTVVGKYKDKKIRVKADKMTFEDDTYIGNINSELVQFNLGEQGGAAYVSGELIYVEWVEGLSTVPEVAPKMRFKSTDGTINMEVFVTSTGTNTYYFDRYIEGIDTNKEYYFEIESGDPRNVSTSNKMNVLFVGTKFEDTVVGNYKNKRIRLKADKIVFESISEIREEIINETNNINDINTKESAEKESVIEENKIDSEGGEIETKTNKN